MSVKKIDVLVLGLYCSFIYWLSSRQSLPAPMWFAHQDKLYHALAYMLMGVLAWRCFRHVVSTPIILGLWSIAFCSLYGFSDEWHQSFVPGRDSSIEDWGADTVGAIIGVILLGMRKPAVSEHYECAVACVYDCPNCAVQEDHNSSH